MWGRLLTKAALLLATLGLAVVANDAGKETDERTQQQVTGEEGARPLVTTPGRNPRVVLITSKNSVQCQKELERLRKTGGDFSAMQAQGWKIGPEDTNHVQLIDQSEVQPEILRKLDTSEYPIIACIENGEVIRSFKDGCSTPLDAWTFGWMLKGVNERPKEPIPEAIRVTTTGSYPLRGNHWSVDGVNNPSKEYLVSHLRSATHVSYLNASYKIEDWSVEELRSLHDDLHEKYGPAAPTGVATGQQPTGINQFSGNRKALGK